jgi:nucleotide-binding universal stress UspA family protein
VLDDSAFGAKRILNSIVRHSSRPCRKRCRRRPCRFRRILVPTDFSEAGGQALRYAVAFAPPCSSEITLIHVIEPPPYPEFGNAHIPAKEAGLKQVAREKLGAQRDELAQAGVKAASVVRYGSAFHEIAEQAREHGSDLIVIPTHGRGAIAHALLGSTTERVVRHAPYPVLVVRERERDFVSPWQGGKIPRGALRHTHRANIVWRQWPTSVLT